MIKICGCAFRKPELAAATWLDHYHERHGPLIASLHGYCAHVAAYRQNYVDPGFAVLPPDVSEAPGGISELWYADLDAANRAFADPEYLDAGRADEDSFVDFTRGISLFGHEQVILPSDEEGPSSWTSEPRHRLFIFRAAAAGMPRATFQQAWLKAGREMACQPWFAPVARYIQTHTLADSDRLRRPARHDLVDEFQFPSAEAALTFARTTPAVTGGAASALTDPNQTLALVARSHLVTGR